MPNYKKKRFVKCTKSYKEDNNYDEIQMTTVRRLVEVYSEYLGEFVDDMCHWNSRVIVP
jgi:hypothetical protein